MGNCPGSCCLINPDTLVLLELACIYLQYAIRSHQADSESSTGYLQRFLCIPNVFNKHCILTIGNRKKILCCHCNTLRNSYYDLLILGQDCQYQ